MNTNASLMRFRNRAKETGQALVLIALLMVILLGMLGLAIDGGGMFLLWRDAQNAVDAAALQAAFAYCTNGEDLIDAQAAGFRAALDNGFNNIDDNIVTIDRAVTVLGATSPELPANATVLNDIIYVGIQAEKPAYFIQLIYGGPLNVNVHALGVCNAGGDNIFDGYAIYAMGTDGLCSTGNDEVKLTGSDAHFYSPIASNADLKVQGSGDGLYWYDGAGVQYTDEIAGSDKFQNSPFVDTNGDGVNDPVEGSGAGDAVAEQPYSSFPTLFTFDQFEPGGEYWDAIDEAYPSGNMTNYYDEDLDLGGGSYEGLYVVVGAVSFSKDFKVGPAGITIVATGDISAGANVNAKNDPVYWRPFTQSLLFFSTNAPGGAPPTSCPSASGGKDVGVNFTASGGVAEGIIYTPYSSISWSGSEYFYCGSMIGWDVTVSGSDKWFFSDEIPTDAELIAAAGSDLDEDHWFIQLNYEGKNCDFIQNSDPNIFLGDTSGN